jgi:taurine dioxygenase
MALDIQPLTALIGAEIGDINLASVSAEDMEQVHKAWMDWKVLFFRDQHITTEEHIAFGRQFGDLEEHPFAVGESDFPEIMMIQSDDKVQYAASGWHSDVTWRQEPSMGSILRGVKIPPVGGDTCFSNAAAAYQRLSDNWKAKIDGLTAVHDFTQVFGGGLSEEDRAEKQEEFPPATHPVVRTHPVTGEKCIYTNRGFTHHVEGVDDGQSKRIISHLEKAIMDPSVQCRFRWEVDSFAMWDNRCTQHFATNDFFPETRRVERVTVIGDRPF